MPCLRASSGLVRVTGSPLTRISPPSGRIAPDSTFTSVLLPAPLSPMSATTSPGKTVKLAAVQRLHVAVALDQVPRLEQWRTGRRLRHRTCQGVIELAASLGNVHIVD